MDLVLIEWVDSHSGRGWNDLDQIERVGDPLYCRSVGWLLSETDQTSILVPHLAGERNESIVQGSGDIVIPKAAILSMRKLA